jgi:hypothetical protein
MNFTEDQEKLLRRALDKASAESEYEKALLEWGKSVRASGVTGHDIIDLARVDHDARENQIREAAYNAGKADNNSPAPAAPSGSAASSWLVLCSLVPLCLAYIRRVAMIACAIGLGAVLHAGAGMLVAPREKTAPRGELVRPTPDHPKQEARAPRKGRETFSF